VQSNDWPSQGQRGHSVRVRVNTSSSSSRPDQRRTSQGQHEHSVRVRDSTEPRGIRIPTLCLAYYCAMQTYGITDVYTHVFWILALVPAALYLGKMEKILQCSLHGRLGRPQSRSERQGEVKIIDHMGLVLRPICRPVRSQSPYRLKYHGS
jgi:hypothetical protein